MATQKESIMFHDSLLTTLNESLRTSLETNLCIYNMFFLRSLFVRINRGASELRRSNRKNKGERSEPSGGLGRAKGWRSLETCL